MKTSMVYRYRTQGLIRRKSQGSPDGNPRKSEGNPKGGRTKSERNRRTSQGNPKGSRRNFHCPRGCCCCCCSVIWWPLLLLFDVAIATAVRIAAVPIYPSMPLRSCRTRNLIDALTTAVLLESAGGPLHLPTYLPTYGFVVLPGTACCCVNTMKTLVIPVCCNPTHM